MHLDADQLFAGFEGRKRDGGLGRFGGDGQGTNLIAGSELVGNVRALRQVINPVNIPAFHEEGISGREFIRIIIIIGVLFLLIIERLNDFDPVTDHLIPGRALFRERHSGKVGGAFLSQRIYFLVFHGGNQIGKILDKQSFFAVFGEIEDEFQLIAPQKARPQINGGLQDLFGVLLLVGDGIVDQFLLNGTGKKGHQLTGLRIGFIAGIVVNHILPCPDPESQGMMTDAGRFRTVIIPAAGRLQAALSAGTFELTKLCLCEGNFGDTAILLPGG